METDELIRALVFDGKSVPEEAIEAAARRRAEMIPAFIAEIDAFLALARPSEAEILASPVFVITLLLGEWRATAAYRPFCRLVRRSGAVIDTLFGDAIQHVASIAVRLFDGDPQPLIDAALDQSAHQSVRSAMVEALVELAVTGVADRGAVEDFIRRAHAELQPRRDNLVWFGWTQAVAVLLLGDMAALAREAIQAGRVPREVTSVKHFNADLAHAERHPEAPWPEGLGVEALEPASVILRNYTGDDGEHRQDAGLPVVNPFRDVGRNDPCPCGSGKKFKKCCLGKDAA